MGRWKAGLNGRVKQCGRKREARGLIWEREQEGEVDRLRGRRKERERQ